MNKSIVWTTLEPVIPATQVMCSRNAKLTKLDYRCCSIYLWQDMNVLSEHNLVTNQLVMKYIQGKLLHKITSLCFCQLVFTKQVKKIHLIITLIESMHSACFVESLAYQVKHCFHLPPILFTFSLIHSLQVCSVAWGSRRLAAMMMMMRMMMITTMKTLPKGMLTAPQYCSMPVSSKLCRRPPGRS